MDNVILIPLSAIGTMGWVATTAIRNIQKAKAVKAVATLHARVLDRCSSGQDMIAYLESQTGRQFLLSTATENQNAAARIMSAVQWGSTLFCIGVAEFAIRREGFRVEVDHLLLITGALALALGVGFVMAAASSYVLCQNWGILTRADAPRG